MNFTLSNEQEWRVEATRGMVRECIDPVLRSHPANPPLPKPAMLQLYAVLAELEVTAARLPRDCGGAGMRMLDYGLVFEQLPPMLALSLLAHESTVANLQVSCSEELRERYLPDLIAGRRIAATAHSEAEAGSDASAVRTRLLPQDGHAVLSGSKRWVGNTGIADLFHVSCIGGADERARFVLVDRELSGDGLGESVGSGLRQGHLGDIVFERSRIPSSHLSAAVEADAVGILARQWHANRPLIGLMCVHLAQRAFEMALDHARDSRQFGKSLSAHQLVQQDLADIETAIVSSRLLCYHALDGFDRGLRSIGSAAMAKRYAMQACERAIHLALQLHGAPGSGEEPGIEGIWRDARLLQASVGMNGVLALIQARELTGVGAFR